VSDMISSGRQRWSKRECARRL